MPRFGSRVTAIATRLTDEVTGTFTLIDNFLRESGVPDGILTSTSGSRGRVGFLQGVFSKLDQEDPDRFHRVLEGLIQRLRRRPGDIESLNSALRESGYEIHDNGTVHSTEILAGDTSQVVDYLDELLAVNKVDLDIDVLRHHLEQHRTLYGQTTAPGAAAGEARQFVEQLLLDVAHAIAEARNQEPNLARPVLVRVYLREQGFFDEDEAKRLVDGVYGYLSEVGSHPGVTDVTMGRMARVVFLNFAVYVLEKFREFPR